MPAFEWQTNGTPDTVPFVTVVRRNTEHKNYENTRVEIKEIWKKKKSKRNSVSFFNMLNFLSSTVEVGGC